MLTLLDLLESLVKFQPDRFKYVTGEESGETYCPIIGVLAPGRRSVVMSLTDRGFYDRRSSGGWILYIDDHDQLRGWDCAGHMFELMIARYKELEQTAMKLKRFTALENMEYHSLRELIRSDVVDIDVAVIATVYASWRSFIYIDQHPEDPV